jgi:hypothetical protein
MVIGISRSIVLARRSDRGLDGCEPSASNRPATARRGARRVTRDIEVLTARGLVRKQGEFYEVSLEGAV